MGSVERESHLLQQEWEQHLLTDTELVMEAEPFARGSWGLVYKMSAPKMVGFLNKLYPGIVVDSLAIKLPRADTFFSTVGPLVEWGVQEEVNRGLEQAVVGIPPAIGAFKVKVEDNRPRVLPVWDSEGILAVVMPKFNEETLQQKMDGGMWTGNDKALMGDVCRRIQLMAMPLTEESSVATRWEMSIIDSRMRACEAADYPFADQAGLVNRAVPVAIARLAPQIENRAKCGKFGAQHGDARPENIMCVRNGEHFSGVILDAVRLVTKENGEEKIMKHWYETDNLLQVGMLLGEMYARVNEGFSGRMFGAGVAAYAEVFEDDVMRDQELAELFGLGLIYGLSVEAHVLNYQRQSLKVVGDKANELAILDGKLYLLWASMADLATDLSIWRERL